MSIYDLGSFELTNVTIGIETFVLIYGGIFMCFFNKTMLYGNYIDILILECEVRRMDAGPSNATKPKGAGKIKSVGSNGEITVSILPLI